MNDITDLYNWQKLNPWKEKDYGQTPLPKKTHFKCKNKILYPTHPSQSLKKYHQYDYADYNRKELQGHEDACMVSRVKSISEGLNDEKLKKILGKGGKIPCLLTDMAYHVILSDTYIDICGNYYRGVYEFYFNKSDESMGTGFSPGRAVLKKPDTEIMDMYAASTYAISLKQFKFVGELLPDDFNKINKERRKALANTHELSRDKLLFIETKYSNL